MDSRPTFAAFVDSKPDGTEQVLYLDAEETAEHIAWRVAHFFDGRAPEELTAQHFSRWLTDNHIEMAIDTGPDGEPRLSYKLIGFHDLAMPAASVAPEVDLPALVERIDELDDYAHANIGGSPLLRVLPQEPEGDQKAYYYKPSEEALQRRGEPVQAAQRKGLAATYLGAQPGDMIATSMTKRVFDFKSKEWHLAKYSKTFTKTDTGFTKVTNGGGTTFQIKPQAASTLDEYVDAAYADGAFAVLGKPIIYRETAGRRTQKPKFAEANVPDANGKPRRPHGGLTIHLKRSFGDTRGNELGLVPQSTHIMPTLLEQPVRAMPIDIDGLTLSRAYDLDTELQDAFEEVRGKLPLSLQKARARFALSSSAGMKDSNNGEVVYDPKTSEMRCRIWLELDHPVLPSEFGKMLVTLAPNIGADTALYSSNQAIYGGPEFVGAPDPLAGKREMHLEGDRMVDLENLRAEFQVHCEEMDVAPEQVLRTPSTSSAAYGEWRGLEHSAPEVRDTAGKLAALGDREAMSRAGTGARDHFGFLRHVIREHLKAAYAEEPPTEPLGTLDVIDPKRNNYVAHQMRILNSLVGEAFEEAVKDPTRETDLARMQEFGFYGGQISASGKYAQLVVSASAELVQKQEQKLSNLTREARLGGRSMCIGSYLNTCCRETALPGIWIEEATSHLVWHKPGHMLIDDPKVSPERRYSYAQHLKPEPVVLGAGVTEPKSLTSNEREALHAVDRLSDLVKDGAIDRTAVFVHGADPEVELQKIKKAAEPFVRRRRDRPRPTPAVAPQPQRAPEPKQESPAPQQQASGPVVRRRSEEDRTKASTQSLRDQMRSLAGQPPVKQPSLKEQLDRFKIGSQQPETPKDPFIRRRRPPVQGL